MTVFFKKYFYDPLLPKAFCSRVPLFFGPGRNKGFDVLREEE